MTKRIIVSFFLIVILLAAGAYAYRHRAATAPSGDARAEAWAVFQKYLSYAKAHDIEGLKTVAYKLSAACTDPSQKQECYSRMDTIYNFAKDVKESDVPYIASDAKQTILYTKQNEHLDGDNPSITRGVLYFARAQDGTLRFLSMEPFQGVFLIRSNLPKGTATSTISAKLEALAKDTDGDMIPDATELCQDESAGPDCVKTDPYKRDTDGDGWWDSIQKLVK